MEVDNNAANLKRSHDESEQPDSPTAELKRRKLGTPEANDAPASRFGAIASAISGVFGNSQPSQEPQKAPPATNGTAAPTQPPPTTQPATTQPATTQAPAAADAKPPVPRPLPKIEIRLPLGAATGRPAIKLSALKGTKWDTSPPKKATPKKATPKPRGRKPAGLPQSASQPISFQNVFDSADLPESPSKSNPPSLQNTPTKPNPFAAVTPKGILTPSKRGRPPKNKNVTFDQHGEVFFADLPKQPSTKKPRAPPKRRQEEDENEIKCAICSKGHSRAPNEIILCDNCDFAVHQECYEVKEIPEGDWLCKSCAQEDVFKPLTAAPDEAVKAKIPEVPNLDHHVKTLQRVLLDRCTGRRRIRMFGQDEAEDKVRQVLEQTVLAGEGNSMLLIGQRGSGKTTVS